MADLNALCDRVRARETRAVARAVSLVEEGGEDARHVLAGLHASAGRAFVIGVTGAPGVGKSTVIDRLIAEFRGAGPVAVIAVDPTSAFSGGALLGDRIRMQSHGLDPDVFVRSMGTRGQLGGLAGATADAVAVLDAAGFVTVLVETIGVGQDEIDIARLADITLLILAPGAGDDVQALKAGTMEIADVFVVNKSDREGADRTVAEITQALALAETGPAPLPPVVLVAAALARGITELGDAVRAFQTGRAAEIEARRRRRAGWRLRDALTCELHAELDRQLSPMAIEEGIRGIHAGEQDPSSAARALVASAFTPLGGLDHVGVAVEDPAALAEFFEQAFGISAERPETVESQQVRVRFLPTGSTRVEVIEPTAETSSLMKFLKARGPGLHHLAFKVPDLEALLGRLAANGVRLIDRVPRRGAENTMIAFVHPSSAGGVLIELVQSGARPVPSA